MANTKQPPIQSADIAKKVLLSFGVLLAIGFARAHNSKGGA